ncbi:MAG: rod shape-determining protein MreC [Pseudomonadota bacterium]|nr:rod shape-determining protein MreC [Pseudomonadota bacterium]
MKRLFTSGPSSAIKLLVLGLVALSLVAVDTLTDWLDPVTARLGQVSLPLQWITAVPGRLGEWGDEALLSRVEWDNENARLRQELLVYSGQLQRMAAISAENARLRSLLSATELLKDRVLVAELIGVSTDPLTHTITINRGAVDGAYQGQPVLDDRGLMGQVIAVGEHASTVLLITDNNHALPVQVIRNGVRAIAEGRGDFRRLQLRFVSPTVDIKEGDHLVSSGLGGRFPVGYPVGTVLDIHRDPGQPFLTVEVEPAANLEQSRHLLLVFSEVESFASEVPPPPADPLPDPETNPADDRAGDD